MVAVGIVLSVWQPWTPFLADLMIKPVDFPVLGSPSDFGLDYESVEFRTTDNVTLRGWLITPASNQNAKANRNSNEHSNAHANTNTNPDTTTVRKVIVQSHMAQASRSGWTPDGKFRFTLLWHQNVTFLRHAAYLTEHGYSVLMYDLRNHGLSDAGSVPWISDGSLERHDVIAAVQYVTNRFPNAAIGLLSVCLGMGLTTYAYGDGAEMESEFKFGEGLQAFDNVKALVGVQPMTYKGFVEGLHFPRFITDSVDAENSR